MQKDACGLWGMGLHYARIIGAWSIHSRGILSAQFATLHCLALAEQEERRESTKGFVAVGIVCRWLR